MLSRKKGCKVRCVVCQNDSAWRNIRFLVEYDVEAEFILAEKKLEEENAKNNQKGVENE